MYTYIAVERDVSGDYGVLAVAVYVYTCTLLCMCPVSCYLCYIIKTDMMRIWCIGYV